MRFDPSLLITRMVIESNARTVYDEAFHPGLNIIRGENSSGKSTLLNFIFYGLGGDLTEWSDAARRCTRVMIEAELSGKPVTLTREVSEVSRQPMDVFGGPYALAQKAPRAEWTRYPYQRSESRESFSQTLFRLLGLPEVRNEVSGNVTAHQVLRLLYADQLTPIDELFRSERFDSALLRDAVGRLMCGAYDSRLYENELLLREREKELEGVSGELRSLFAVIGRSGESLTPEWAEAERARIINEQLETQSGIEKAERNLFLAADIDQASRSAQEEAYTEVQRLQEELSKRRGRRDATALDIADSDRFLASLEGKLEALSDASAVANVIVDMHFRFCPACQAPLNDEHPTGTCHLCKSPFDPERAKARVAAQINETAIQIRQSRLLQQERAKRLERLDSELNELDARWRVASARLREFSRLPSSEIQDRLRRLQRQAGYLERQLEDLDHRTETIALVSRLSARKEELSTEIGRLRASIDTARASQQQRFEKAKTAIADEVLNLLHNDLRREESFEYAKQVNFDFAANRIKVDDQSYFSASSRAYLKTSFSAGFLFAATKDRLFRHPRFCMIDIVEDKGMEPDRTRNLQIQIAERCQNAPSRHQLIFATSMIAPELEDERFTVGRFSTRDNHTLNFSDD
ncbi:MAG: AAA family ATPase [Acetobacteraceae bacterium]